MRRACWLLALAFVSDADAQPMPERLVTRRWQVEDGLPQNSANAVVQTHEGYLWVATYAGLARFDGHRFRLFNQESMPRLSNDRITALGETQKGELWIGSETGELVRFTGNVFENQALPEAWTPTKIACIAADERDDLWVIDRNGGLISVREGKLEQPPKSGDPAWITNGLVKEFGSGTLWGLRTGVLGVFKAGMWQPVKLPDPVVDQPVQVIGAARDGGIWAVIHGRLWKWQPEGWRDEGPLGPWSGSGLNALCEWEPGVLAIGTVETGLYLVRPGHSEQRIGRTERVGDNWIQSLTVDAEGALWVGTAMAGVSALQRTNYDQLMPPERLGAHPLKTIAARREGGMWVGTEGGGVYRFADGGWTGLGRAEGLTSLYVWSVLEDQNGHLWAGTWGGGVFRMERGRFERVPGLEDPRELVAALFEASDGSMWVGTVHGLKRYRNGEVTSYGVEQGLASPEVRAIAEDASGGVWFGLAGGGLGVVREGKVKLFGVAEGLNADYIVCLYFDDTGALWLGSTAGGITRFKQGKFVRLGREQGFPSGTVGHISDDGHGNFWMTSDRGFFRIPRTALDACADGITPRLTYERFGGGEGMERVENAAGSQPAGWRTSDGLLWYPARQGVVRVDPAQRSSPSVLPQLILEEFVVDGESIARGIESGKAAPTLVIPAGHERFEFRYTAPTFAGPERIRFRYRLQGLDGGWIDAGEDRSAGYHHLAPGGYIFEVMAFDGERAGEPLKVGVAFTVEPRWWQRWWVRLLGYLTAALAIAGGVIWQQRRSHRQKTEQLERQQALERERTRIARDIHDDLGASLTRISLLSQSARRELDDPAQSARRIDSIYATARELTHKMDEIVWAVNPRHDSLESVAHYLASFAQEMLGPAGVACRLEMPLQFPAWPVFAEARHHLFLAFKEALNNVVKHAHATCATLSLEASATELILRVQDDGCGLRASGGVPPSAGHGNGLPNMRQRLADVGGRCEIGEAPGGGTCVVFYLPLRGARPPHVN